MPLRGLAPYLKLQSGGFVIADDINSSGKVKRRWGISSVDGWALGMPGPGPEWHPAPGVKLTLEALGTCRSCSEPLRTAPNSLRTAPNRSEAPFWIGTKCATSSSIGQMANSHMDLQIDMQLHCKMQHTPKTHDIPYGTLYYLLIPYNTL